MYITHVLPNGKEIRLKEILFKDIRTFNFYENTAIQGRVEFLQSFILTKGLNILEQFYALIYLRLHCIGNDIIMTSDKGDVGVSLDFIKENIGGIPDILTSVDIDGAEYTLDFPFHFNTGNDDFILSLIKTIRIGTETLHVSDLSKKEQEEVVERLPERLYKIIDPTSIYLDNEIIGDHTHEMSALVWGMGDEQNADMDELEAFGFQLIGEKPPENWTGHPVDYCRY